MYILRFLGVVFALIVSFFISLLAKIDYINLLTLVAFIMAVDSAVLRIIKQVYMNAVIDSLTENPPKDKEDE